MIKKRFPPLIKFKFVLNIIISFLNSVKFFLKNLKVLEFFFNFFTKVIANFVYKNYFIYRINNRQRLENIERKSSHY